MRRTPIYICTSDDLERPSIGIARLSSHYNFRHASTRSVTQSSFGIVDFPDISAPHIQVSLVLNEHQRLDSRLLKQWLSTVPVMATYATVEVVSGGIGIKSCSKCFRLRNEERRTENTVSFCFTPLHRQKSMCREKTYSIKDISQSVDKT